MPREGHFYLLFVCCFFILDSLMRISMIGMIIITDDADAITIRQVLCSSIPLIMLFTFTTIIPTKMTMINRNNIFGEPIC
jgi:hypothetical protein